MRLSPALGVPAVSALVATLLAPAAGAADSELVRGPDGWLRVEGHETWQVDPEVVTVRFVDSVGTFDAFLARLGADAGPLADLALVRSNRLGFHDLKVPAGADVIAVRDLLRASDLVEHAQENTVGRYVGLANDPSFGNQEHLVNSGQAGGTTDADIDADLAWDLETGSPDIIVAVLDSGSEFSHEDLSGNVWMNADEPPGNGVDDDGNGFVDDIVGWDFESNDNKPDSGFYHGTFVAGVVGARTNNGIGVAGVAGGWGDEPGCALMLCNVGSFSPVTSALDDAILYAVDNGARVITMSLTVGNDVAIEAALDAAGAAGVFVNNAAGNGFGGPVGFPANHPNVVAVGGTTDDDDYWSTASAGPEVWVSALGDNVYSLDLNDGYSFSSGTSFSSPQVAGVAGLIFSVLPAATAADVKEILKVTADDVASPGFDDQTGWGRINAHAAVQHALDNDCDGNGAYDPTELASGTGDDFNGNGVLDGCEPFRSSVAELSLAAGGTVGFDLDAPGAFTGDTYVVLGSSTGTAPGIDFGGWNLPLNLDPYFLSSLKGAGGSIFDTTGALGAGGDATAALNVPPGQSPSLSGLTLHHAYLVLGGGASVIFTSNEQPLLLVD